MNLREVREAAELHREGIKADIDVVVDYALAIIDPSPDEPITADWLREVWGAEELNDGVVQARILFSSHPPYIGSVELGRDAILICETPTAITTRQQFCDLARCLGISRKQPRKDGAK